VGRILGVVLVVVVILFLVRAFRRAKV